LSTRLGTAPRLRLLDLIRGFGLFGIFVVNLPFMANTIYHEPQLASLGLIDRFVTLLVSALFQLKFYLLFSFVFGYSFGLQIESEREEPSKIHAFRRRLAGLFAFGLLDSVFLFVGDILTSYALLGVLLLKVRQSPPRRLWRMGLGAVLLAILVYGGAVFAMGGEDLSPSKEVLEHATKAYSGSFWRGAMQRAGDLLLVLPFLAITNWLPAFGMFCWGLAAAKTGTFEDISEFLSQQRSRALLCLAVGLPANLLFAFAVTDQPVSIWGFFSIALSPASAVCLSFAYLYGLAWVHFRWPARTAPLESAGRLSLSNYLGQNLSGCFLFCGWGLGQLGRFGPTQLFLIAAGWFLMQLIVSIYYSRWFLLGPDEWVLRSFSRGRWQPFRRIRAGVPAIGHR
jgi:uncharacterized protein